MSIKSASQCIYFFSIFFRKHNKAYDLRCTQKPRHQVVAAMQASGFTTSALLTPISSRTESSNIKTNANFMQVSTITSASFTSAKQIYCTLSIQLVHFHAHTPAHLDTCENWTTAHVHTCTPAQLQTCKPACDAHMHTWTHANTGQQQICNLAHVATCTTSPCAQVQ